VATLCVNPRPINDDFAGRIPLIGATVRTSESNRYATAEPNEPAHAGYGPFNSVWWSYTPALRGIITADLTNSFYGAVLGVYTGTNLSQLSLVASNAFGNLDGTAKVRFLGEPGTAYQIAAEGYAPQIWGTIDLCITGDFPPSISSQPQNQAVAEGESAAFGVVANSQSPLSYQWLFNGSEIPGATNPVFSLGAVSTNDLGQYSVEVMNDVGSVASSNAALSLTTVLIGQITDAATGDPLTGVLVWAGSVTNASGTNGEYALAGVQATILNADFEASVRSGLAPLSVQFLDQSTLNAVVVVAETNGYFAYTNNQIQLLPGQALTNSFSLSPILAPGTMRLVLNWGAQPRDLDAHLLTPAIDGQAYHIYYQTGSRGSLTNAPFAALEHDATNGFGPETVTIAQFFPGTYSYFAHKYAGIGPLTGSAATLKIYTDAGLVQTLAAPSTGGGDYWIACTIDGASGNVTLVDLVQSASPADEVPVGGKLPAPPAVGTSGRFQPKDLPPGAASFLWDFGDGHQSTLEDPINVYANPGFYTVTFTVTTSNNVVQPATKTNYIRALPSTSQPPAIVSQPANQTVIVGATATFQAMASGSAPLRYQWFFNQTSPLAGATNNTLMVNNAQSANAGGYSVVVTNQAGGVTSSVAALTVLTPPSITRQPADVTTNQGANVAFSIAAAGSLPLNYQWWFNGTTLIAPATNATLILLAVQPSQAGSYSATVANAAGAANSSAALLTLLQPPPPLSVSITTPANEAAFLFGADIPVLASASEPMGSVKSLSVFNLSPDHANQLLASSASGSCSFNWTNAPSGTNFLAAVATDALGSSATSAVVRVIITNAATPGLGVALAAPPNDSSFCLGNNVLLSASVTNAQLGAVVEFFAGGTLLGQAVSAPYQYTWPAPQVGVYTLSAKATDLQGNTAISTQSVNITVAPQCAPVAIVRAAPGPEIVALQAYLSQMGLGSQVFDQAGLSANLLGGFELVIWDDAGVGTNGLAATTVDVLNSLYAVGIPLYLIGEHLVSAGASLPSSEQAAWVGLTHLGAVSGGACSGTMTINDSEGASNPVLWGQFWTVTNFVYAEAIESATNDAASEVLAQCGGNSALAVYPPVGAPGPTPLAAQNLRVLPPNAAAATDDVLEGLFKNAVCWLTRCENCQDVGLGLTSSETNEVVIAGQPMSYTLVATCNGECPPVGVTLTNFLPEGFMFLGATNVQGTWTYDPVHQDVVFSIGLMPQDGTLNFSVAVQPTQAGRFTNQGVISLSLGGTNSRQWTLEPPIVTMVLAGTNAAPGRLSARLLSGSGLELTLLGQPETVYQVETSTNLMQWGLLANVMGPTWTQIFLPQPGTNASRQFYRAPASQ
jgi:uncharacterized repeat protein (TIGR01451 family)